MIVEVEMVAFADQGKSFGIREVEIPDAEAARLSEEKLLELIFRYGQNDFQPKQVPSVSVGDVIRIDGKRFLVSAMGFKKIGKEEEGGLMRGYELSGLE